MQNSACWAAGARDLIQRGPPPPNTLLLLLRLLLQPLDEDRSTTVQLTIASPHCHPCDSIDGCCDNNYGNHTNLTCYYDAASCHYFLHSYYYSYDYYYHYYYNYDSYDYDACYCSCSPYGSYFC